MKTNSVVLDKTHLAPHLVLLKLRPERPLGFKAGQFAIVSLPQDPLAAAGAKPPKGFYSIASAEQDQREFELLVELREHYVSKWMASRRASDQLSLEGPLGKFGLSGQARPQAFLGFKAGVAPLRAMILSLLTAGFKAPLSLFLGEPELVFDAEWKALQAKYPQFHYAPAADPARALAAAMPGREGVDVYCAGFNHEVDPMLASLSAAGFDKSLLKAEKFG
jgi:NAD(P)H-flavin reductase